MKPPLSGSCLTLLIIFVASIVAFVWSGGPIFALMIMLFGFWGLLLWTVDVLSSPRSTAGSGNANEIPRHSEPPTE